MKEKWKNRILQGFLMLGILVLARPVLAQDTYGRLYDEAGVLTEEQEEELNRLLDDLYETYDYESVIYIADSVNEKDIRRSAAAYMQTYGFGAGESGKEGMCLIHVPSARDVGLVARGDSQEEFDEDVTDHILDEIVPLLKKDDFFGAYKETEEILIRCLKRYSEGKTIRSMDIEGSSVGWVLLKSFLISLIPAAMISAILGAVNMKKLNSIRPQKGAAAYMADGGLRLTREDDIYLRTDVIRTKRPENHDSGSGGGGSSGTFSSGGESFSGSSRSY